MVNSKVTNQKFIKQLKLAKKNLDLCSKKSSFQQLDSFAAAEIFWTEPWRNAIFADGKLFSFDYLKNFPKNQRRAATIAVIDASIRTLEELEKS